MLEKFVWVWSCWSPSKTLPIKTGKLTEKKKKKLAFTVWLAAYTYPLYDMIWYEVFSVHKIAACRLNYNVQEKTHSMIKKQSNKYDNSPQKNKLEAGEHWGKLNARRPIQLDYCTCISISASSSEHGAGRVWRCSSMVEARYMVGLPCISPLHGGINLLVLGKGLCKLKPTMLLRPGW